MVTPDSAQSRILKLNSGFSLIELLIAIAIISILAAIAIPQFVSYRARSVDAQMHSDLKSAALAMESYYAEYKVYPTSLSAISSTGFRQTAGVGLVITVTSPSTFTLTASTPNGSQPTFTFDSSTGLIN
jgi:type IV pilus assembly protein PilA